MHRLVLVGIVSLLCFSCLAVDEIRIGFMGPLTGWAWVYGQYVLEGVQLGLEEVGYQFRGIPIRLIVGDTRGESERVVDLLEQFKHRDRVHVVIGPSLGHEGMAAVDWANKNRDLPIVVGYSAPEDMTMRFKTYNLIRPGWTGPQTIFFYGWYAAKVLGLKRIIMVGQDYSFPWDQAAGFIRGFLENGGEVVERIWHEVELLDFGAIMLRLQAMAGQYDAVLYNGAGGPAVAFFRAWVDFDMYKFYPILLGGSNFTDPGSLPEFGPEAVGLLTTQFYCPMLTNPYNIAFKEKLRARFGRDIPAYPHVQGYDAIRVILKALEAIDGRADDTQAFLKAMYEVDMYDSPRGPWKFDAWGNPIMNIYLQRVEMIDGKLVNVPVGTFVGVSQFGPYVGWEQQYLAQPRNSRFYPPGTYAEYMKEIERWFGASYIEMLRANNGWPNVVFIMGEPTW